MSAGRRLKAEPPRFDVVEPEEARDIGSEAHRRRLEIYARARLNRRDINLNLAPSKNSGSFTDMQGNITINSDIPPGGTPEEIELCMRGLLRHELLHERITDPEVFRKFIEDMPRFAGQHGPQAPEQLRTIWNILEDGMIESREKVEYPDSYAYIAALNKLYPRVGQTRAAERELRFPAPEDYVPEDADGNPLPVQNGEVIISAGTRISPWGKKPWDKMLQVEAALLAESVPGFEPGELHPDVQAALDELRPMIENALSGNSADCVANAYGIFAELKKRGLLFEPSQQAQQQAKGAVGQLDPTAPEMDPNGQQGQQGQQGGQQQGGGGMQQPLNGMPQQGSEEMGEELRDAMQQGGQGGEQGEQQQGGGQEGQQQSSGGGGLGTPQQGGDQQGGGGGQPDPNQQGGGQQGGDHQGGGQGGEQGEGQEGQQGGSGGGQGGEKQDENSQQGGTGGGQGQDGQDEKGNEQGAGGGQGGDQKDKNGEQGAGGGQGDQQDKNGEQGGAGGDQGQDKQGQGQGAGGDKNDQSGQQGGDQGGQDSSQSGAQGGKGGQPGQGSDAETKGTTQREQGGDPGRGGKGEAGGFDMSKPLPEKDLKKDQSISDKKLKEMLGDARRDLAADRAQQKAKANADIRKGRIAGDQWKMPGDQSCESQRNLSRRVREARSSQGVRSALSDEAFELQRLGSQLEERLKRIKSEARGPMRYQRRGKLDQRRLSQAMAGNERVFFKPGVNIEMDMEIDVSIDRSGSVTGTDTVNQFRMAKMFSIASKKTDIPVSIYGWEGGGRGVQHYAFKESFSDDMTGLDAIFQTGGGGTPTAQAVEFSRARLKKAKAKNKMMVIVTDGGANDVEGTRAQVEAAKKQGIQVLGLAFGDNCAKELMDQQFGPGNWEAIDDYTKAPRIVGDLIEKLAKRKGMRR